MKKKKTILITGVMGHIGFGLAVYLSNNYKVIGIFNHKKSLSKTKILRSKKVILIKDNLEKFESLKKIFIKYNIKDCIYAAGIAHNTVAKKNVDKTIKVNCLSVNFFLEAQFKKYFEKFIYISTGSVFQNIESSKKKIIESNKASPNSIYSISKRLGETLIETFFKKNKKKSCSLRVSWVYGPPLLTKKIVPQRGPIPYIIQKLFVESKKIVRFTSGGKFAASFTSIDDVCRSISEMLLLKKFSHPVYHFGSGRNFSNLELARIFNKLYPQKKVFFGNGVKPWSDDSVIRGPLSTKYKYSFLKSKISLEQGISNFVKLIKNKIS